MVGYYIFGYWYFGHWLFTRASGHVAFCAEDLQLSAEIRGEAGHGEGGHTAVFKFQVHHLPVYHIVVAVVNKYKHPLYKKTVSTTKKYKAHDELNECGIGDTVRIVETRKLSKDKNWRLLEIVEKAK